jgi:transposase
MGYTGAYSAWRRFRDLLRGKGVQELSKLQRQGMSIPAISELTGWDRKTIRKHMQTAGVVPEYGPRRAQPSKLDAFKPYLEERLRAGVWNARVLLRELRERNYTGSYTTLTDWLRPQRSSARVVAVRRFETAPGKQAQVDGGASGHARDSREGAECDGENLCAITTTVCNARFSPKEKSKRA